MNSTKRAGHRPTSPKSPVASASAFESIEGSDDEDNIVDDSKLNTYIHTNGNAVSLINFSLSLRLLRILLDDVFVQLLISLCHESCLLLLYVIVTADVVFTAFQ